MEIRILKDNNLYLAERYDDKKGWISIVQSLSTSQTKCEQNVIDMYLTLKIEFSRNYVVNRFDV